jgi:hypothetical protein
LVLLVLVAVNIGLLVVVLVEVMLPLEVVAQVHINLHMLELELVDILIQQLKHLQQKHTLVVVVEVLVDGEPHIPVGTVVPVLSSLHTQPDK